MNYMEMAPDRGTMYALYTDRMEYKPYERNQLPSETEISLGLLELHLFDENKEYRYINKRKGQIELCIEDSVEPHEDTYEEVIYTIDLAKEAEHISADAAESSQRKVGIVNYINYDENDLMVISNYRLKEVRA